MKKVFTLWDESYITNASGTILSTHKAKGVVERAMAEGLIHLQRPVCHETLAWVDMATVHDPRYVEALRTGAPKNLACSQGFRWSPQFARSIARIWTGQQQAVRAATRHKLVLHPVSGAHHAGYESGAGFCSANFLVGAARFAIDHGLAARVGILDLDVHLGDGTYRLIERTPEIECLDINEHNWGVEHPLCLTVSTGAAYLNVLRLALPQWLDRFQPSLVCYQAGMDPHESDPVGGIPGMTARRLAVRDAYVLRTLRDRGIPVVVNLAGGYQPHITEGLHVQTIRIMAAVQAGTDVFDDTAADMEPGDTATAWGAGAGAPGQPEPEAGGAGVLAV